MFWSTPTNSFPSKDLISKCDFTEEQDGGGFQSIDSVHKGKVLGGQE